MAACSLLRLISILDDFFSSFFICNVLASVIWYAIEITRSNHNIIMVFFIIVVPNCWVVLSSRLVFAIWVWSSVLLMRTTISVFGINYLSSVRTKRTEIILFCQKLMLIVLHCVPRPTSISIFNAPSSCCMHIPFDTVYSKMLKSFINPITCTFVVVVRCSFYYIV